jgi:L-asparaginase/N4-(beta-N-acetylglucosaminyl)-L-asparaginase
MPNRRSFLKTGALASVLAPPLFAAPGGGSSSRGRAQSPVVVSTWRHGLPAKEAAWAVLDDGGPALDAVEQGVAVSEADPAVRTVGRGGYPDRTGQVTLDACVMDKKSRCGSVAALPHIQHPTAVARAVMEKTPHVMLVGEGALAIALDQGFEKTEPLTDPSQQDWEKWKQKHGEPTRPEPNIEDETGTDNHDTIGMLALDLRSTLLGACTTSGTRWKMHGRVGNSPLIGAGLYVDNEVGAACATGWGEAVHQ